MKDVPVTFTVTLTAPNTHLFSFLLASKEGNVEVAIGEGTVKPLDKLRIALVEPKGANYEKNPFFPSDNSFNAYKYYLLTVKLPNGYNRVIFHNRENENCAIIPLKFGRGSLNPEEQTEEEEEEGEESKQDQDEEKNGPVKEERRETEDFASPMISTASVGLLAFSFLLAA